jgi:hypothetical protein
MILVAVALCLVTGGLVGFGSDVIGHRTGPLTTEDPEGATGNGFASLRVGDLRCYGYVQISNPESRPATIKRVTVQNAEGLSIGPITVLPADRGEYLHATAETCPSGGAPAQGYVIPPDRLAKGPKGYGVEVLIPLTVSSPGEHRITGVTVTYEYAGDTFQVEQGSDLQMCTTPCDIGPP